jgi:RND family efflux transporter MFP subunit
MKTGWPAVLLFACPALLGCGSSQAQPGLTPPPTPEVLVSLPVTREVTDYVDFPGRIEAVNSVEVRARVTGYLEKVHFKEGEDVKQGDILFEIDPRPYQADFDRAEANFVQAQAHLSRLETDYQRALELLPGRRISREEFDRIAGDRREGSAAVGVAKANRDLSSLNLSFTKVKAPLTGRISRRYIDPGNLVKADDTPLTSIVSLNPIYAYFDADERTTLRLQRLVREHKIKWSPEDGLPVQLGLADEEGFSKQGRINFADNRVDADTGTWRLRGIFANADQSLSPGLFVRMRAPVGERYRATLISEQALSTDQDQKSVFVVSDQNKVEYRRVKVGALHDGLRVIKENLAPNERVIVSGLQRVRAGIEVSPKLVDMPVVAGTR